MHWIFAVPVFAFLIILDTQSEVLGNVLTIVGVPFYFMLDILFTILKLYRKIIKVEIG